jgi:hypothetical protein
MQLDRSRFLLLTSALAAATAVSFTAGLGGCSKADSTTDGGATTDATASDSSPVEDGSTDAADASTADASGCLTNDGLPPNCDPYDGGAQCNYQCQAAARHFKNQVAVKAAACIDQNMNIAPTCEGGEPACVEAATAAACTDPAAAPFCAGFLASCADAGDGGTITQAECLSIANGLSGGGRDYLTTCVASSDCRFCLDMLKTAL